MTVVNGIYVDDRPDDKFIVQMYPNLEYKTENREVTLINHKTNQVFDLSFDDALYWAARVVAINDSFVKEEHFEAWMTPVIKDED